MWLLKIHMNSDETNRKANNDMSCRIHCGMSDDSIVRFIDRTLIHADDSFNQYSPFSSPFSYAKT